MLHTRRMLTGIVPTIIRADQAERIVNHLASIGQRVAGLLLA